MTTIAQPLTEETDPHVLPPTDLAALLFDAPWRRYGVFGDSLSLGMGDPTPGYENLGWPARVERVLRMVRPDLEYLNTARFRATTAQALDEQGRRMREFKPDLLHVNSGANDIVRRTPDWDRIEGDLRDMYTFAARTGAQLAVYTLGRAYLVPVFPDWTERLLRLNDITRNLAGEFDAVLVDSENHPLNDRPNLLSEDKIHFSTSGQAILATLMVRQLAHRLS
ncbi:SGNH/GDSL hydrolase family protein [Nocardia sp. SYP-A9097]|uniref:SGNH/GDSL hydrolase family protein n=1 Tax=Nocardia sp. SYP-A9097 TaxID=2663237 RepID=UPI00129AF8F8|nr:SGNH/GDSL hydrolase family protein [Nocardia sp. SYP-A9097]MRH87338.1 SGNH/GDSL hydrolase family protein [Nocardia sp. SYP-A9097]